MPFYRFEGDDIALGEDFAIVAHGQRRFLLESLSAGDVAWLRAARDGARIEAQTGNPQIFNFLLQQHLLADTESARVIRVTARLPSRWVGVLATPLKPLMGAVPLLLSLVAALLVLFGVNFLAAGSAKPLSGSLSAWLLIPGIWLLSLVVHELGHAAACLRFTGTVGAIRLTRGRVLLGLATDVSSLFKARPIERGLIAAGGIVVQSVFAAAVALTGPLGLLPSSIAVAAANLVVMTAAYCAVPASRSDGYWALRDFLGTQLEPRLVLKPGGSVVGLCWGYCLLAIRLALLSSAVMVVVRQVVRV